MAQHFNFREFKCVLTAGYPAAGSTEPEGPKFVDQLLATKRVPKNVRPQDLVCWIIARLTELTYGALPFEGDEFRSDGSDFGYRVKVSKADGELLGHWSIHFWPHRISFSGFSTCNFDGQSLIIEMLTDAPRELGKCEIKVLNQDDQSERRFGWDGFQYL